MTARNAMRVPRLVAAAVLAAGIALVAMRVAVEGEPGALPLLLVLIGGGGLLGLHLSARRRGR